MLFETGLLLIISAGLINGSFVVPMRYVKNLTNQKVWFFHSLIGLILIPWLLLALLSPSSFGYYPLLQPNSWLLLLLSGLIFGLGQICFAYAIEKIGIALSFTINLGIGITIGSLFVAFYREVFFTAQGLLATIALLLILTSLIINYYAGIKQTQTKVTQPISLPYKVGWLLATIAGLASGLQNIAFVIVAYQTKLQANDTFWVWPPFLTAAGLFMLGGFGYKLIKTPVSKIYPTPFKTLISNSVLIILMGLFFTGSLVLYSSGMNHLTYREQVIGWPSLMIAIILTTQIWGWIYGETKGLNKQSLFYKLASIILLIIAIAVLSIKF